MKDGKLDAENISAKNFDHVLDAEGTKAKLKDIDAE